MEEFLLHKIKDENLYLVPERAIWWPAKRFLIVADIHLGKASHFNRNGYALPNVHAKQDLKKLGILAKGLEAKKLVVLGDLFHSEINKEFDLWRNFVEEISPVEVVMIRGNHDILDRAYYHESGTILYDDFMVEDDFIFVHDLEKLNFNLEEHQYVFSGHLHPGFSLWGKGNQSLRLPCFYFAEKYAVLPAYGSLTGLYRVNHKFPSDNIYVIAGEKLTKVPNKLEL